MRERGYQPEIRTAFEPGTWKPDACYEEMKGAVASFTDYEVPFVGRRTAHDAAHDGTGIFSTTADARFSNPIVRERLGQLSWFKLGSSRPTWPWLS